MYPVLRDGAEVEVDLDAYCDGPPLPGDLVLAQHPFKPDVTLVKRVLRVESDGRVFVVGEDVTGSSDSRGFGALRPDLILGRVSPPRG